MGFIISIIFFTQIISLFLSKVNSGRFAKWSKIFRVFTLVCSISLFTYWFVKKSSIGIVSNSVSLQVINKLPQPLDFYVINVNNLDKSGTFETRHIGNIRPEYYRTEYLKLTKSDQYWIVGYLGKKNMVYFSQHAVPNKNMDQIVEAQNYIIQSEKLSEQAKKHVETYNFENMQMGIWVTLCFLLMFLNISLLVRKK